MTRIKSLTKGVRSAPEKRRIVVSQIKADTMSDVNAMRGVAGAAANSPTWADIGGQKAKGAQKEKEALVAEVRGRILAGESQIASQDIDSLVS